MNCISNMHIVIYTLPHSTSSEIIWTQSHTLDERPVALSKKGNKNSYLINLAIVMPQD